MSWRPASSFSASQPSSSGSTRGSARTGSVPKRELRCPRRVILGSSPMSAKIVQQMERKLLITRHGPARPDHRFPQTRSHRPAQADGPVEPDHDDEGRATRRSPSSGSTRGSARTGSVPKRESRCPRRVILGPGPMSAKIVQRMERKLLITRHGPARPDHRFPQTRSHRPAQADGPVEPDHDDEGRATRRSPSSGSTRGSARTGSVPKRESRCPRRVILGSSPMSAKIVQRMERKLLITRHGPARPDHRFPQTRSHRPAQADGPVEPDHDDKGAGDPPLATLF